MIFLPSHLIKLRASFNHDFCWLVSPLALVRQLFMPQASNSNWSTFIGRWVATIAILVIVDDLPDISSDELIHQVRTIQPAIRTVVFSNSLAGLNPAAVNPILVADLGLHNACRCAHFRTGAED